MRNLSLQYKLLLSFLPVVFAIVAVGYVSIRNTQHINTLFSTFTQIDTPRLHALLEMKNAVGTVKAKTIEFQLLAKGSSQVEGTEAADIKFGLLAAMEQVTSWREEYTRYLDPEDHGRVTFLDEISALQDEIILTSLGLIELKERGITDERVGMSETALNSTVGQLERLISDTVSQESVRVAQSGREAIAGTEWINRLAIFVAGIALLVSVGMGFILSRLIVNPLSALRNAAVEIAGGNLNKKLTPRSKDEIGQLALTFNTMAGKLKDFYGELETKVEARTTELEKKTDELEALKGSLEKAVQERTKELEKLKENLEKMVVERTKELEKNILELTKFKEVTVGRELKMIELKKELAQLNAQRGKAGKKKM